MKTPKHPTITPMRAHALLRRLDESYPKIACEQGSGARAVLDDVRDALSNHVKAALVRGGKRNR